MTPPSGTQGAPDEVEDATATSVEPAVTHDQAAALVCAAVARDPARYLDQEVTSLATPRRLMGGFLPPSRWRPFARRRWFARLASRVRQELREHERFAAALHVLTRAEETKIRSEGSSIMTDMIRDASDHEAMATLKELLFKRLEEEPRVTMNDLLDLARQHQPAAVWMRDWVTDVVLEWNDQARARRNASRTQD